MTKTIEIYFVAFPDGQNIWIKKDDEYLKKCIDAWKNDLTAEKKKKYEDGGVLSCAGCLRMFEEDYLKIQANNKFPWPDNKYLTPAN